jgi:hypothetical protein
MKKLLFLLFITVFWVSCQGEFDNVKYTITNDSSKDIKFTFNDITETLAKDTSIVYTVSSEKGRFAPENPIYSGHKKSVNLETLNNGAAGIFYTFTDNAPLTLNVVNTLSIPVTVKADDFIEYDDGETAIEIIEIKEKGKETALIYTPTPNFSVEESDEDKRTPDTSKSGYFIPYPYPYPIEFDWELTDDNTINLTIK